MLNAIQTIGRHLNDGMFIKLLNLFDCTWKGDGHIYICNASYASYIYINCRYIQKWIKTYIFHTILCATLPYYTEIILSHSLSYSFWFSLNFFFFERERDREREDIRRHSNKFINHLLHLSMLLLAEWTKQKQLNKFIHSYYSVLQLFTFRGLDFRFLIVLSVAFVFLVWVVYTYIVRR